MSGVASKLRYDIWMRCYPQADVNVSEEWEMLPMTLQEASKLIDQMERDYEDDAWRGHRMYKAKFYPMEMER